MYSATELDLNRTIAALASAPGPAARGIIRISGPQSIRVLQQFLGDATPQPDFNLKSAQRYECSLPFGKFHSPLPLSILLWPTSRSYTGQQTAEIHTIGSPPILSALLDQLYQLDARPAQPGEFTLRAVLAGKLTLLQAEAVLGVIDAETEETLDQALSQLAGGISTVMRQIRDDLLSDLADLEAGLDFVEEDIEFVQREDFIQRLKRIEQELAEIADAADKRMLSQTRFRVVLAGLPNAGKSSLFNVLTGERALVSDREGTTTDYLSAAIDWNGLQLEFLDTAGWERSHSEIQKSAQQYRAEQIEHADLILWCVSASLSESERALDRTRYIELQEQQPDSPRILTKYDLIESQDIPDDIAVAISVSNQQGMDGLWRLVEEEFHASRTTKRTLLGSSASRCRDALHRAHLQIVAAKELAEMGGGDELIAEEIRGTLRELGMILGQVHTDDLLDLVFSRFCIGK